MLASIRRHMVDDRNGLVKSLCWPEPTRHVNMTLDIILDPPWLSQRGSCSFMWMDNCRAFRPIKDTPHMHLTESAIIAAVSMGDFSSFRLLIKGECLNQQPNFAAWSLCRDVWQEFLVNNHFWKESYLLIVFSEDHSFSTNLSWILVSLSTLRLGARGQTTE